MKRIEIAHPVIYRIYADVKLSDLNFYTVHGISGVRAQHRMGFFMENREVIGLAMFERPIHGALFIFIRQRIK